MTGNTRKLLVPLATMAVAAAVTVGSGADWSSSTTSTTQVTGGALTATNSGDGAQLDVSNMKPGDVVTGSVTITNTGSVPAKLAIEQTAATNTFYLDTGTDRVATTDDVSDLQLRIDRDGTVIYDGNFDDFKDYGLTDITAGDELAAHDAVPATPDDTTLITFKVRLISTANTASQNKTASATFSFVATPADGSPLTGVFN